MMLLRIITVIFLVSVEFVISNPDQGKSSNLVSLKIVKYTGHYLIENIHPCKVLSTTFIFMFPPYHILFLLTSVLGF